MLNGLRQDTPLLCVEPYVLFEIMPNSCAVFIITSVATAPSRSTIGASLVVSARFGTTLSAAPYILTV